MSQKSDDKSLSLDEALPGLGDEDEATDYVFRIISTFRPEDLSTYTRMTEINVYCAV